MRAVEVLLIAAAVMAMMMAVYISHCHNRIHISGNRDSGIVVEG